MEDKSSKTHINIVGAGPGGLTAAMLLARRGFKVRIFEKAAQVGGRNAAIIRNGYKFDTGPTFLMMKFILDEVFEEADRNINDYLKPVKLEPMYRLQFKGTDSNPRLKEKPCFSKSMEFSRVTGTGTIVLWLQKNGASS